MTIQLEGIRNARELGGLTARDGRVIRSGCLVRSGDLNRATERDLRMLKELGVSAVVDFRDRAAAKKAPDRLPRGAKLYHWPVLALMEVCSSEDEARLEKEIFEDPVGMMRLAYEDMALGEAARDGFRNFFHLLLRPEIDGVLWHCSQGKDRTGVAALLLLTALGVPDETIEEEYLLSNLAMQREYDAILQSDIPQKEKDFWKTELFVGRENLRGFVKTLNKAYGGVWEYLHTALGLTGEDLEQLRDKYLMEAKP